MIMIFALDPVTPWNTKYSHVVPGHYKRHRMNYAKPYYLKESFGDFFIQEVLIDGGRIYRVTCSIQQDVCLYSCLNSNGIALHLMLQGAISYGVNGAEVTDLLPEQFQLLYLPESGERIEFREGFFNLFFIWLTPKYFYRLATRYKAIRELIGKVENVSEIGMLLPIGHIDYEIKILLRFLVEMAKDGVGMELELEAGVLKLLSRYDDVLKSAENDLSNDDRSIEDICTFIQCNFADPELSIRGIAEHFKFSIRNLERSFRKQFNCSPRDYCRKVRMKNGLFMLLNTDKSIKNISYEIGYLTPLVFSRTFRKFYNCTPKFARDHPLFFSGMDDDCKLSF
jgi:AraC-like DNA-binding protein